MEMRLMLDREVKDKGVAHERLDEVLVLLMRLVVVGGIVHNRHTHIIVAITFRLERDNKALIQSFVSALTARLRACLNANEVAIAALPPAGIPKGDETLDDLPTLIGSRPQRILEENDVTDQARFVFLGGKRLSTNHCQC